MRFKWEIAAGLLIVAGLAAWVLRFNGVPGMLLIFFTIVMVPGFLAARLLSPNSFDYLEIYAIAFAIGASLFNLVGILLFIVKSRIDAAYWIMLAIGVVLLLINFLVKQRDERPDDAADNRQLKWSFLITVIVITIIAAALGGFRGWGEDWDYYSYITMVRRLAERGLADTYPLAYAGEAHDPIHSYNAWALLWAVISRGAGIDPIALYLRSTILTVPAALLAIYALCKSLFGKNAGYVAGILYAAYHLFGMGMILLGQSSFFNDDPAWLIFFPVAVALGWYYIERGGRGLLALAVMVSAGAFITHPLWGAMIVPAFGLMLLVSFRSKSNIPRLYNTVALSGAAIFIIPLIFSIFMLATGLSIKTAWPGLTVGLIIFILLPALLIAPWIFERTRSAWKDGYVRCAWAIIGLSAVALAPFFILRFMEAAIRRPEIGFETSPYKIFITSNLFVLSPWNFSYTAPDMTLYPYCLIGVFALPWLVWRYIKGDRAAGLTAAGILLVPVMATQPYVAYLFAKAAHVAYLRRALRFGAIFAACAAGGLVAAGVLRRPGYAAFSAIIAAAVVGIVAAVYPYSPPYFQGAFAKSLFIMARAPSRGLFWSPDYDVYKASDGKWDTERFSTLLDQVPAGETVFSDRFTSYRLTAYRDVYVECREKPSTGAVDQVVREVDQAKFFDPVTDNAGRCLILQKYKARWALLNLDENYRLREYYLGDPWTAEKLENDPRFFTRAGKSGDWVLFKTTGACW